jgi:hypothetical protein
MAACGGNFQRAFNIFLAFYFAKIAVVIAKAVIKLVAGVYNFGLQGEVAVKKADYCFMLSTP